MQQIPGGGVEEAEPYFVSTVDELKEAIKKADTNSDGYIDIEMISDIQATSIFNKNGIIRINGNGKKLSIEGANTIGTNCYLENVVLEKSSTNNKICFKNNSELTIDNVKLTSDSTADFIVNLGNKTTLNILGVAAEGTVTKGYICLNGSCTTNININPNRKVNTNIYRDKKGIIKYTNTSDSVKLYKGTEEISTKLGEMQEVTQNTGISAATYTVRTDGDTLADVDLSMNSYNKAGVKITTAADITGGFCSINQNRDYAVIAGDEGYVISSIKLDGKEISGSYKGKRAWRWDIPSNLEAGSYSLSAEFKYGKPLTISNEDEQKCDLKITKNGDTTPLESGEVIGTDDILSISYGLKENVSSNYEAVLETKGLKKIADTENQYKATGKEDPVVSVKSKIKDEFTVATPVIIKDKDHKQFTISCDTDGATIYYTIDGSDPLTSETRQKYTEPISYADWIISKTVNAAAVKEDWNNSAVANASRKLFSVTVEADISKEFFTSTATINDKPIDYTAGCITTSAEEGDVIALKPVADEGYGIYKVSIRGVAQGTTDLIAEDNGEYKYTITGTERTTEIGFIVKAYKKIAVEIANPDTAAGKIAIENLPEEYMGGTLTIKAEVNEGYRLQSVEYLRSDRTSWETASAKGDNTYQINIDAANNNPDKVTIRANFIAGTRVTEINNEADFKKFAEQINAGDNYKDIDVKLNTDVALTGEWQTLKYFAGTFDGDGHTVSGLSITSADSVYKSGNYNYYGLFGEAATIKNLTVKGKIDITHDTAGSIYAGGIAGEADSITGCSSYVDINIQSEPKHAYSYIGGITGSGDVSSCINFGDISLISKEYQNATTTGNPADGNIGGIVGAAKSKGTIANCKNYGDLKYKGNTILNQDHAEVDGAGGRFGGIVGNSRIGTVINCVNKGNITGDMQRAGGIVGDTYFDNNSSVATIQNCYNTGNITSTGSNYNYSIRIRLGGIFGTSGFCVGNVDVSDCYSTGNVTANFTSDTAKLSIGEIHANEVDRNLYSTSDRGGTYTLSNVYGPSEIKNKTISDFTDYVYVADTAGINGGYPILEWEATSSLPEDKYAVSFNVTAGDKSVDADSIKVFRDAAMTAEIDYEDGLKLGTYYYKVTKAGYLDAEGSFSVAVKPVTVDVAMQAKAVIKFNVTPAGASVTVTDGFGREVTPVNGEYYLAKDNIYTYSIYKEGYNGVTRELSVTKDSTITVALTEAVKTDNVITATSSTITVGGTYKLGDGFTGTIKVQTGDAVTIAGSGIGTNNIYRNIYIDCTSQVSNLTLQDIYISNDIGSANMINFKGTGNRLNFAGTSILDMNTGATGYAMIHVPDNTSLTVTGGTLYMYKREQGAGIGGNGGAKGSEGQTAETNGDITISNATIFAKNSKQGALIGAGAQSGTQQPGNITIENSDLNLIAVSRSAAIGGSAGSTGASKGSYVTARNSRININVDYSGSAIGGGGYADGNDADGGTLVVDGSSIRTFIDTNAVDLWNVSSAGVNGNKAITAAIKNAAGNSMYLAQINTAEVSTKGTYTVKADNKTVYSGGLHQYRYINENLPKGSQKNIEYTIDNWTALNDDNLYVYLEGKTQDITVNGDKYKAEFNSLTKEFTVTKVIEAVKEVTVIKGDTVKVAVPVEVKADGTEATVTVTDKNVEEMLKQAKENKADEIIFTADETQIKETEKINITLDTKTVKSIAGDTTASITVNTPAGNLTFDQAALDKIAADAKGTTITITIEKVKLPDKGTLVLIGNNAQIYNLTVKSGKEEIKQFKGNVTVSLPIPDSLKGKNVIAVHIADGKLEIVKGKIVGDRYQFTSTHFGQYALVDGDTVKIDETDEGTLEKVKSLTKELKLKAPTSLTSKKSVKVTAKVTKGSISEITDLGYKVKYKYYRSVKKASKYSLKKTKSTKTYTNTAGKKGQKYYYKVRVYVYDADGKIAASTTFGQCKYGYRTWRK